MKFISVIAIVGIVLLGGCYKKSNDLVLHPETSYTFTNNTQKPIIVRVGDSLAEDPFYINIGVGQKAMIPNSRLTIGNAVRGMAYYWASTDFSMSSWYLSSIHDQREKTSFGYVASRYVYNIVIEPVRQSKRMQYCLNGIDGTTTWVAVNAYDNAGISIWNTLSNPDRNHKITLDYLQQGTHDRSTSMGANITDYMGYYFKDTLNKDVWIYSYNYSSAEQAVGSNYYIEMTNDLSGIAPLYSTSTDTLYMMANRKPIYYLMVKQH